MSGKLLVISAVIVILAGAGTALLLSLPDLFREPLQPTVIPAAAWSRDVAAGGYQDGAPIGGLGAGTITWRYDGSFYKGRLRIGKNRMDIDKNCGFFMYQKPSDQEASAISLDAGSLGEGQAKYYSLFPKSWVDYYGDKFTCKAKVTQFSPLIPGDYKNSSYPVGVYSWELTNPSSKACDVSVMLAWNNDFGGVSAEPVTDKAKKVVGLRFVNAPEGSAPAKDSCEFSIAGGQAKGTKVTYASAADIDKLKDDFSKDGVLNNTAGAGAMGGVSVSVTLRPGQTVRFPVILSWDMPVAEGFTKNDWYREYTRYFGRTGANSWNIAKEALENASAWEASIDKWQAGILEDGAYPDWLKTSLFNELYYYSAGGTIWEAGAASGQPDDPEEDMFSSLECYDYPYYGTLDVSFYGSWALLQLWPDLEKQSVKQFCDSVYTEREDRPKPLGTAAHDFGGYGSAFKKWNAYNFRDSTNWKDLNSKLVLMVFRDWALTGKTDSEFLKYCWIPVQKAMEKVKSQDADGDGLPDSNGIDQTYDTMSLTGNTAYCGSLFLAACEAAGEIAKAMGDTGLSDTYKSWLEKGKASFEGKLWNGSHYRIDTGSGDTSRIMSDQLCGQWYAAACGLPGIVPDENARSVFNRIYEYNFKKFDGGANGIVNVMLPSGEIDTSSSQSAESWVGTSWGVAAGMIQQGLTDQADEIGKSLFGTIWDRGELWFRTPEAWQSGLMGVRSPYYMRATTVWAVKQAYDMTRVEVRAPEN